jgi:hypothetical protein
MTLLVGTLGLYAVAVVVSLLFMVLIASVMVILHRRDDEDGEGQ